MFSFVNFSKPFHENPNSKKQKLMNSTLAETFDFDVDPKENYWEFLNEVS